MTLAPEQRTGTLETQVIQRMLRVPRIDGWPGDGLAMTRRLDAALLGVGFKLSPELFEHLASRTPDAVASKAVDVLAAVRELVGDHVRHNVYFRRFPEGVPDTHEFWAQCIREALGDPMARDLVALQLSMGTVNLLDLPSYGRYQHSYEEMLAAHVELVPTLKDRVTVLHLGGSMADEIRDLYYSLAASPVPANEADLELLAELAGYHTTEWAVPEVMPVRERRAVVNAALLEATRSLRADTVTDVLRAVVVSSGGDVSLQTPSRLRSLRRAERRAVMATLDDVVTQSWAKLADVEHYAEQWKRLGELVHPHEYSHLVGAHAVFEVARGERRERSLVSRVEQAFAVGDRAAAARLLAKAPGMLARSVDRLLRGATPGEIDVVVTSLEASLPDVSSRVICSLLEHLQNRAEAAPARVFTNQRGRAWVTADDRAPLKPDVVERVSCALEDALDIRLPRCERLVVDPAVYPVAVPLSGKAVADGFAILPRGSVTPVEGDTLRFFIYWKQAQRRTDYDLSALLLDEDFSAVGHLSWTALSRFDGVHSGDLTEAADGASEFIDLNLRRVTARYIVPEVNIYSGEGFDEVAESMFGFMTRDAVQAGLPFEPRTVRMRSELRGPGRVALPLMFGRADDGSWAAKWLHLTMAGYPHFNRVESNRMSTSLLVRSIAGRRYLTVGSLLGLWSRQVPELIEHAPGAVYTEPVTFVGLERPEGLPEGSEVYTPGRIPELLA